MLANVLYIAADAEPKLAPEMVVHEPPQAFRGGSDGLDLVRRLIAQGVRPSV